MTVAQGAIDGLVFPVDDPEVIRSHRLGATFSEGVAEADEKAPLS